MVNDSTQSSEAPPISVWPTVVMGVVALGVCVWLISDSVEYIQSGSWPRANGTVESRQMLKSRSGTQHLVKIRYNFTVDGAGYKGERFNTRGDYLSDEQVASVVASQYTPGRPCSVAYNPSNPARCFIETSITWHTWGKVVIGAVAGWWGYSFSG